MKSRRHVTLEDVAELNLVPYMDIMVNLIMFLLLSMTGFVQMKIINVSMPSINDEGGDGSTPPPATPKLAIVVGIVHKKGFLISLNGQFEAAPVPGMPTIPVLPDGQYDYIKLRDRLTEIKSRDPQLTALTMVPEPAVDYQTMVKTMDEIRRDKDGKVLFPDVLMAVQ